MFNKIVEKAFFDELVKLGAWYSPAVDGARKVKSIIATLKADAAFERKGRAFFEEARGLGKTDKTVNQLINEAKNARGMLGTASDENVLAFMDNLDKEYKKTHGFYAKNKKKIIAGGLLGGGALLLSSAAASSRPSTSQYGGYPQIIETSAEMPVNG